MINIVNESHKILQEYLNPNLVLDMTCGRGNDTVFLAEIAKKVIAIDIQNEAIISTRNLVAYNDLKNVEIIQDNHRFIKNHVKSKVDLAIYNLGYLPNSDKSIKTNSTDVIASLDYLLDILNNYGIIVIVMYANNPKENLEIEDYVSKISNNFDVSEFRVLNKENCPYIIKIKRVV